MIVFSIDTKNQVFSTDTKKIQSSCFPVKCFVVKSVKQDQDISEDREFFEKFKQNVKKNMQHRKEVCNVTLVSEHNERITGGSCVCEYPFKDTFQTDDKNTCFY